MAAENPYPEIFTQIEVAAAATDGFSPQAAYVLYDNQLVERGLDPTIYFSMALTSGGAARDESLAFPEVMAFNSLYVNLARRAFLHNHPQLAESDVIVPSDLGKVRGWTQADFLLFWNHVIVGLEPTQAAPISQAVAPLLQAAGFTDPTCTQSQKWNDYQALAHGYVQELQKHAPNTGHGPNNIQALLTVLDSNRTLGGRQEALLARRLGIPPQVAFLDSEILASNEEFVAMTKRLSALGATAIGKNANPPDVRFAGISEGFTNPNIAYQLGFRKTGLMNAVLAAEFYAQNPGSRPKRHEGHNPVCKSDVTASQLRSSAELTAEYYLHHG